MSTHSGNLLSPHVEGSRPPADPVRRPRKARPRSGGLGGGPVARESPGDREEKEATSPPSAGGTFGSRPAESQNGLEASERPGGTVRTAPTLPLAPGGSVKMLPTLSLAAGGSVKTLPTLPLSAGDSVKTLPTLPPGAGGSVRIDSEASARAPELPPDLFYPSTGSPGRRSGAGAPLVGAGT